ncbi:shikimate transporter ShiA [Gordonia polyisoprenivorans VH2]|uniref:Shikimate transporter ShiA n=1 Tax=Gordonia polyisoprenivorans (strain DSM 44266 / VH2) TaxID=1112204 RepID=H6N4I2_GORPV|nr:MFS transporter [Gordonia polyisoprenivorans]AFA73564.1 shikimate transporter ShiA [Gordonia polyisoprenivorans VH2]
MTTEHNVSAPPDTGEEVERMTPAARRALLGAAAGTLIEWFDYALYGSLAAILARELFFPEVSPGLGVLAAFGAYGVAFVVRPLGGLVIGRIGDRYGRKPGLVLSLTIMGLSTFAIAFLPTFAVAGYWAAVLLVVLRLLQGFGAGAENAGALALVAEYAPLRQRGFYTALMQSVVLVGVLLATVAFLLVSALPREAQLSWGWRVPFLSAGLMLLVAFYIRSRLEESPEFVAVAEKTRNAGSKPVQPIALLFGTMKARLVAMFVIISAYNVFAACLTSFVSSYLRNTVEVSAMQALGAVSVGTLFGAVAAPAFGAACDRYGFRPVWRVAAWTTIPGVFAMFFGLSTGNFWIAALSISLAYVIPYAAGAGAFPGLLANVFPAQVRFSGIATVREFSAALVAGTFPFIATALVLASGGAPWLVAGYIAIWSVLGLLAIGWLGHHSETPATRNLMVDQSEPTS